ncbi:MAG: SpoIIE family protein phosphatase [bacterium]|nr:SpoIIE family protein phosphatase [bacterium]
MRFISSCLFLLIVCLPVVNSCSGEVHKQAPSAKNGILDLRGWDFKKDGLVKLSGEWEFYWEQFLLSDDFSGENPPVPTGLIDVPASWNGFIKDGKKLSGKGYATYRLKVFMDETMSTKESFDFKFLTISTAFTVYVNGKKISSVGRPGKTFKTSSPAFLTRVADAGCLGNEQVIIIHVSNFHQYRGGIWDVVLFGRDEDILKSRERNLAVKLLLFGSIFIMGLYHLGLFINRRKNKSTLYFGIVCLVTSFRILLVGELFFMDIIPGTGFELLMKMKYLSFYVGVPFVVLFVYSLFRQDYSKWFLYSILFLGTGFSTLVIFTPARIFSYTLLPFQSITFVCGVYTTFALILSIIRKREDAGILLTGFSVTFLTVINDILFSNNIAATGNYVSFGIFVFIFSQAYFLSRRFSKAFLSVERLSGDLETKNRELYRLDKLKDKFLLELEELNKTLEDKVIQRTEELLFAKEEVEAINKNLMEKNEELETAQSIALQDMKMAISVQSKFLPGSAPLSDTWDIAYLFKPMAGVSGDFYDFYDFNGTLKGVGLFDVSGHGISSGLVTMIAKSVLFRNFHFGLLLQLNKVLELANKELIDEIGEVENYLTGLLLRFHEGEDGEDKGKIDYVNAGHPGIVYKNAGASETKMITGENGEPISGKFLGIPMLADPYESVSFPIDRGDYLLLYTDGLSESGNSNNSQFGQKNILRSFQEAPNGSSHAVLKYIYDEFTAFTGTDTLKDDLTIIVIRKK